MTGDRGGSGHWHVGTGHTHAQSPADFGLAFALGVLLNLAFVTVEALFGLFSHSMALLADAGHNLSDVLGLLLAWGAVALSKRPPSGRYTYGLKGSSILAALFNAIILMLAVGAIAWESIGRLYSPQPVASATIVAVAAAGIVVNGITAWLFAAGRKHDLNIRGAYLHMMADAAVSLGVVAAGLAIGLTGALWIDPVSSLVIVVVIAWTTWDLLRDSLTLSLAGVPAKINAVAVSRYLEARDGVRSVHDLHIWSISTTDVAMTAHLVMPGGHPGDAFLLETARGLEDHFKIGHVALQIETGETGCPLAPPGVV